MHHPINIVTISGGSPEQSQTLLGSFVLAVAHSEYVYIPIPFILVADFCY